MPASRRRPCPRGRTRTARTRRMQLERLAPNQPVRRLATEHDRHPVATRDRPRYRRRRRVRVRHHGQANGRNERAEHAPQPTMSHRQPPCAGTRDWRARQLATLVPWRSWVNRRSRPATRPVDRLPAAVAETPIRDRKARATRSRIAKAALESSSNRATRRRRSTRSPTLPTSVAARSFAISPPRRRSSSTISSPSAIRRCNSFEAVLPASRHW